MHNQFFDESQSLWINKVGNPQLHERNDYDEKLIQRNSSFIQANSFNFQWKAVHNRVGEFIPIEYHFILSLLKDFYGRETSPERYAFRFTKTEDNTIGHKQYTKKGYFWYLRKDHYLKAI